MADAKAGGVIIKFGEYFGCDTKDVPTDYLVWLATRSSLKQQPRLKLAARNELDDRDELQRMPSAVIHKQPTEATK